MVKIDIITSMNQVNKILEISEEISDKSVKNMELTIKGLSTGWKSENSTKLQCKADRLNNKIQKTADTLKDIAMDMERIVKELYVAEKNAVEIVKHRKEES